MRMRSVEIHGFKSFCQRVTLSFPSSITTIVGPNGCGKSNILDAILWVIGERSAKHLRGKIMEDVIFAGANGVKPLGMAEVNLILANDDGLCPERYKEFEEIMISRRLFRSGESEYAINKTPCRLRDILDLFLDMGVGNQAYSIVEQGKIEAIISAKPEERRIFIEEAAGIAKFRERKKEAISRMEQTEQNLVRIQDVIGEVRRQIQSLEKQVKRAEQFKSLRREIRDVELALAWSEYRRLSQEQTENEEALARLKEEEASSSTRLKETEEKAHALKTRCADWEERISATERTVYEIRASIDREEGRVEALDRELAGLKRLEAQYGEEIDALNAKLRSAKKQEASFQEELRILEEKLMQREAELEAKKVGWRAIHERWEEKNSGLEDEKADLVELMSRQAERTNQIAFCDRTLRELATRKERNAEEVQETEEKIDKLRASVLEREETQGSLEERQMRCGEEAKVLEEEIDGLRDDIVKTESHLRSIDQRLQTASSKLRSLEELQKSFEGFDEGVRTVMALRDSQLSGIEGVVADMIETEPPYEAAVGAALAHRLQYLIVENHGQGLEAIELLKKRGGGRIGLIPMNLKRPVSRRSFPTDSSREVTGPLLNFVRVKARYEGLGVLLLGNTWLVKDLDQAIQVWQEGASFDALVTLEGDLVDLSGVITGGSRSDQAFQILERRREIKKLTAEVASGQSEVERIASSLEGLKQRMEERHLRLETTTREQQSLAMEVVATGRDIERLTREGQDHQRRLEVLLFEQEQLASQIGQTAEEVLEARKDLQELVRNLEAKRGAIEQTGATLEELEKQKNLVDEEMTELQVEIAGYREQKRGTQRNLESLEEQQSDLREQVSRRLEILEENRKSMKKTEQDITDAKALIQTSKEKQEGIKEQLALEKGELKERSKELRDLDDLSRREQLRLEGIRKTIHEKNLRLAETHLNLNHVVESILERYRIDIRISPVPEEVQTEKATADQAQLDRLKTSLDSLGEVNLVALQEYEDLKERADFLTEQHDDLKASLSRLRKAIQRIDQTTERRFLEAFEGANEKFQALFPRLFNGGKAALVLTNEEDILNTGVEVMAQLPGKQLRSLDLLSGGEKALVAIALIFSLFLYRPSPFCILDEVDAPLDDANVMKFVKIIQELSDRSQFLIITHNKKTMETAHTLYGITMESPGISKVVSVELNDPRPSLPEKTAERIATP